MRTALKEQSSKFVLMGRKSTLMMTAGIINLKGTIITSSRTAPKGYRGSVWTNSENHFYRIYQTVILFLDRHSTMMIGAKQNSVQKFSSSFFLLLFLDSISMM